MYHKCDGGNDHLTKEALRRLSYSYAKLELWNQADYSRLIFLDNTMIVLRSIDKLFRLNVSIAASLKRHRTCASVRCSINSWKGGCKELLSTDILVITPDLPLYYEGLNYLTNPNTMKDLPKHLACKYGEKSILTFLIFRNGGFGCLEKTFNCGAWKPDKELCGDFNIQDSPALSDRSNSIHILNYNHRSEAEIWQPLKYQMTSSPLGIWHRLDCIRRGSCVPSHTDPSHEWYMTFGSFLNEVPEALAVASTILSEVGFVGNSSKLFQED